MRDAYLSVVCLALLAGRVLSADDNAVAASGSPASSSPTAATDAKETEMMDVAESSNGNNSTVADEDAASLERSNSKRTIDHNLGYGYRYNTVLRPVSAGHPLGPLAHPMHHYLAQPRRPSALPAYKFHGLPAVQGLQGLPARYPHYFTSSASSGALGGALGGSPFRYSQPLPPPREEISVAHAHAAHEPMAPRPVTEAPSAPHADGPTLYRQQQHAEHSPFAFEDDKQTKSEAESAEPQPVQYADDAAAQSYQHVLQAEPTYFLTSAASAPGATSVLGASPLAAMYSHSVGHASTAHPVMYAAPHGAAHTAATQMIPVIIVRLMDSQTAAALASTSKLGHTMDPVAHSMPYPLVNMQFLRDYISKLYASAAPSATAQHQYEPAESVVYSSPLYSPTQLHKLQMQQQLHAQLQRQLQVQQQQQRHASPSVAAILQEQHRQRVAAQHAQHAVQQGRTEVTVHRSPAMSPQDYKESVEQQEES